jgi:hypothetical protein
MAAAASLARSLVQIGRSTLWRGAHSWWQAVRPAAGCTAGGGLGAYVHAAREVNAYVKICRDVSRRSTFRGPLRCCPISTAHGRTSCQPSASGAEMRRPLPVSTRWPAPAAIIRSPGCYERHMEYEVKRNQSQRRHTI